MKDNILEKLIKQLRSQGQNRRDSRVMAIDILRRSGNLEPGTTKLTKKGKERSEMGSSGRAIDRASKLSGRPKEDYTYNKKTNRAILKNK